jgi:hypothetical protein
MYTKCWWNFVKPTDRRRGKEREPSMTQRRRVTSTIGEGRLKK